MLDESSTNPRRTFEPSKLVELAHSLAVHGLIQPITVRPKGDRSEVTRYDRDLGVRSGDLGIVTRLGEDNSMTVRLDSGRTAELSPEKTRHLDYGYTVDALKNVRAERVIATVDGLTQQAFRGALRKPTSTSNNRNASTGLGVQHR